MHPIRAIVLQIAAVFSFTVMAALIRWIGARAATGEVVFARSFFALIPILLVLAWQGELRQSLHTNNFPGHLLRSASGVGAMFATFAGFALLPLADAIAIGFAAPLITVALAAILLGETVRIYRWSAVLIGFLGVIVMLVPQFAQGGERGMQPLGAAFALAGAFLTALAMTQVRRLTATESTGSIVLYFSTISAVAAFLTLPFGWIWPPLLDATVLVGIGILGGIGQIFLTQSYRYGDASLVAPFSYSSILWSLVLGYILFGESPEPIVLAGAAIVIAAGLFVIWRERQLGLDRTPARQAETPSGTTPAG